MSITQTHIQKPIFVMTKPGNISYLCIIKVLTFFLLANNGWQCVDLEKNNKYNRSMFVKSFIVGIAHSS